jgi:hypothetical protein
MADIDDDIRISLIFKEAGSFYNLPRGLRSSRIFNII